VGPAKAPGEKLIRSSSSGFQNNVAPQPRQKPRVAAGDDRYQANPSPRSTRNPSIGTEAAAQ
jgi:hypothetical protein